MKQVTDLWISDDVTMVTVNNMPNGLLSVSRVFDALAKAGVNIDMISYVPTRGNTTSVSFSIDSCDFAKTMETLAGFQSKLGEDATQVNTGNMKLTLHGEAMREEVGVAASAFAALAAEGIDVKLITTSETEIALLIDECDSDRAVEVLNQKFSL